MTKDRASFCVRSKIWIEDDEGNVVFGSGRYHILDAIERTGSMNAAAKELRMSYRAVWMRISRSEECIGRKLTIRNGKGSQLTPFAKTLMKQFRRLLTIVRSETDETYEDLINGHLSLPRKGSEKK